MGRYSRRIVKYKASLGYVGRFHLKREVGRRGKGKEGKGVKRKGAGEMCISKVLALKTHGPEFHAQSSHKINWAKGLLLLISGNPETGRSLEFTGQPAKPT